MGHSSSSSRSSQKIKTTGVLNPHTNTRVAHAEIVNLGEKTITVDVKVLEWITNAPDGSLVIDTQTFDLQPNQWVNPVFSLTAPLTHYEMRFRIHRDADNILINCFGVVNDTFGNNEGNTIFNSELTEIKRF
jgi:hypothetical protein